MDQSWSNYGSSMEQLWIKLGATIDQSWSYLRGRNFQTGHSNLESPSLEQRWINPGATMDQAWSNANGKCFSRYRAPARGAAAGTPQGHKLCISIDFYMKKYSILNS